MEETLPTSSSLSSRFHAITHQSSTSTPNVVPNSPFRHRRRSRPKGRPPVPVQSTSTATPSTSLPVPRPSSARPLHRIRTRISIFDRSSRSVQQLTPHSSASPKIERTTSSFPVQPSNNTMSTATSIPSSTESPTSSALKQEEINSDLRKARPRRMVTNTPVINKRSMRRLVPPPRSVFLDQNCASITEFLRPALVRTCHSSSGVHVDPSFKAYTHLLRKLTIDDFDINRYLLIYKPLARVNCVLTSALLSVADIDQRTCPLSPALRSATMYVTGNSHRNLYVMTFAAQLKSTFKSRPAAEGALPGMVIEGIGLSDAEVTALDYCQQVSSSQAAVMETTRRKLQRLISDPDGKLERLITASTAYASFLSTMTCTIDIELTHASIQFATQNLDGLPWKCSGSPINVDFINDQVGDFGSGNGASGLGSKYRPKRERLSLTRNFERQGHDRSTSFGKQNGFKRMSQFITSAFSGAKGTNDVSRATEEWMKQAEIPPGGQLFDMNDKIQEFYGFHPFYFSTSAMDNESKRRAFLFGVKELLFSEKELSLRLKFIICYVLSSSKERRRILDSEISHSFEKQGIHNGHSINSVYSHRTYDSLSIMSAHAAFLACKYGAKPDELVAATDESRVRSAMEGYALDRNSKVSRSHIGFPLSRRDCAAVLMAHSLSKDTAFITEEDLRNFENIFGYPGKLKESVDESSRSTLLEIIGCASMWHCVERFATGTLGFDLDFSSNMMFGLGRAEPIISEFCHSLEGKKIGLSLSSKELRDVIRARSDSPTSPTSSLRKQGQRVKRLYNKRTSSALNL